MKITSKKARRNGCQSTEPRSWEGLEVRAMQTIVDDTPLQMEVWRPLAATAQATMVALRLAHLLHSSRYWANHRRKFIPDRAADWRLACRRSGKALHHRRHIHHRLVPLVDLVPHDERALCDEHTFCILRTSLSSCGIPTVHCCWWRKGLGEEHRNWAVSTTRFRDSTPLMATRDLC